MSTRNLTIAAAVVVVILLGWWLINSQQSKTSIPETPTTQTLPEVSIFPATTASPSAEVSETEVVITNAGFSLKDVTIKAGESVTWANSDSANHTVNSSPHPVHTDYPPLNLGTIAPGSSKSLTFPTAGTYKYHDHLNPSSTGSVTVE